MKYFWFTLKYMIFMIWSLFLNTFFYLRFYFNALVGGFNSDYNTSEIKKGFSLSFKDDFNGSEINWSKWNKWWSDGNGVDPTQTAAITSLDCISLQNSILKLITLRNDDPLTSNKFPCKSGQLVGMYDTYCNGGIKEIKGYEQNYGYYEIRCKVPINGKKFWPAFWVWGDMWPPEIDFFEFMSSQDIGTNHTKGISFTTHWGYDGKQNKSFLFGGKLGRTYRKLFGISVNWDEHFHVYGCNWTPHYIDWYIDNIRVYRNIYNIPSNRMSITIGIGAWIEQPPTDEELPGELLVDYIRAYLKN
jgi:beta-glucanase (GH16 family)